MNNKSVYAGDNMPFSDDELTCAACLVCEALADSLPQEKELSHQFSLPFAARMDALIKKDKRRGAAKRLVRSAAAILLAVLVGSGIWLAFDAEARAK